MQSNNLLFPVLVMVLSACGGGSDSGEPSTNNQPPIITSSTAISVNENTISTEYIATASDVDSSELTFSLTSGEDKGLFSIDSVSGVLNFITPPDFETPLDADSNNIYLVEISVSDGISSVAQLVIVTVLNLSELRTPPLANIEFPPQLSKTEGETVLVRGTASSDGHIAYLNVNGVEASSNDNFANWTVEVPLVSGVNTLTVETGDLDQNINEAAAAVEIESVLEGNFPSENNILKNPVSIALDKNNNRLLIVDNELDSIISIALSTGEQTIFSDSSTPDDIAPFQSPTSIELDGESNRLLVTDVSLNALLAVDLDTGARSILNDNIYTAIDLALDTKNQQVLVTTLRTEEIFSVDLSSGVKSLFWNDPFYDPDSRDNKSRFITIDRENERALVLEFGYQGNLFELDLSSRQRQVLSDENTPNTNNIFIWPARVTMDSSRNRVLVIDDFSNAIVAVDLDTGERTIISDQESPNTVNALSGPRDIVVDDSSNISYVVDNHLLAIVVVDLITGHRVIL